jgi:hypothetical protein
VINKEMNTFKCKIARSQINTFHVSKLKIEIFKLNH